MTDTPPGSAPHPRDTPATEGAGLELLRRSLQEVAAIQAALLPAGAAEGLPDDVARTVALRAGRLRRQLVRLARCVEDLAHGACHDPLTGLPNRALLDDRLLQAVAHADRHGTEVAVLVIDLDGFKAINDLHGHAAGDCILRHVADQLRHCIRASDTACRFGGDEFVVVVPDVAGPEQLQTLRQRIAACVGRPIGWQDRLVGVTASIGIAIYPRDSRDCDGLIASADAAMFRDKRRAAAGAAATAAHWRPSLVAGLAGGVAAAAGP